MDSPSLGKVRRQLRHALEVSENKENYINRVEAETIQLTDEVKNLTTKLTESRTTIAKLRKENNNFGHDLEAREKDQEGLQKELDRCTRKQQLSKERILNLLDQQERDAEDQKALIRANTGLMADLGNAAALSRALQVRHVEDKKALLRENAGLKDDVTIAAVVIGNMQAEIDQLREETTQIVTNANEFQSAKQQHSTMSTVRTIYEVKPTADTDIHQGIKDFVDTTKGNKLAAHRIETAANLLFDTTSPATYTAASRPDSPIRAYTLPAQAIGIFCHIDDLYHFLRLFTAASACTTFVTTDPWLWKSKYFTLDRNGPISKLMEHVLRRKSTTTTNATTDTKPPLLAGFGKALTVKQAQASALGDNLPDGDIPCPSHVTQNPQSATTVQEETSSLGFYLGGSVSSPPLPISDSC
jgi:hypothetical protein